jgi:membrane peptidoglycan carboxypeptidase
LLKTGGLHIYTTIDPKLQDKAEEIVRKQAKYNKKYFNASNAALVSLDSKNSGVLAMVGGVDYFDVKNL